MTVRTWYFSPKDHNPITHYYENSKLLLFMNWWRLLSDIWCSAAGMRYQPCAPQRISQCVQHQEKQRSSPIIQTVLHEHAEPQTSQHVFLQTATRGPQVSSLTNSLELSTTQGATSCEATRQFPSIVWNPKVHCWMHKSSSPVPILSQTKSVRSTPSYLPTIHLNTIHPPRSWSS
jgi:hypothetical protein